MVAPITAVVVLVLGGEWLGGDSDGVVYFVWREALCLEELDALLNGCILGLIKVSGERDDLGGRGRLAFGSDKNATAFFKRSCLSMF